MQVSALGLCHVGDSCLHTIARELVVVIAQWTSNSVHLLSWPNLVCSLLLFTSLSWHDNQLPSVVLDANLDACHVNFDNHHIPLKASSYLLRH